MDATLDKPDTDPLLPAVEEALLLSGMSATRFGYTVCGDPALVGKMRGTYGKPLILKTRRRATLERALAMLNAAPVPAFVTKRKRGPVKR